MAAPEQRRSFWRAGRRVFRWLRIALLCLVLTGVGGLTYLNQVGLPDFLKTRLVVELRAHGFDLHFAQLRVSGYREIVAEHIVFGRPDDPWGPKLQLDEVVLRLNPRALRRLELRVDSLFIRKGSFVWPVNAPNEPPRVFKVENLSTELRFRDHDRWQLAQFSADCLGARLHLGATITNASQIAAWNWSGGGGGAARTPAANWQQKLRQIVEVSEQLRFTRPPVLRLQVYGDARAPDTFAAKIVLDVPEVDSPWGRLETVRVEGRLDPAPSTNDQLTAEVALRIQNAALPAVRFQQGHFAARLRQTFSRPVPLGVDWEGRAEIVQTDWAAAGAVNVEARTERNELDRLQTRAHFVGAGLTATNLSVRQIELTAELTNRVADLAFLAGQAQIKLDDAKRAAATLDHGEASLNWSLRTDAPGTGTNPPRGFLAALAPYDLEFAVNLASAHGLGVEVTRAKASGAWHEPKLGFEGLELESDAGTFGASGIFDITSRILSLELEATPEWSRVLALATTNPPTWLTELQVHSPTRLDLSGGAVLPTWTNWPPANWREDVLSTLELEGQLAWPAGLAFRNISVKNARARFALSDQVFQLTELRLRRAEGGMDLRGDYDLRSRDFHAAFDCRVDLALLASFLNEKGKRAVSYWEAAKPPRLRGEAAGRLGAWDQLTVNASVGATNFSFRTVPCDDLSATLSYSNRFFLLTDVLAQRGTNVLRAPAIGIDVARELVFVTNGFGTMDPQLVARAIGPKTEKTLAPYRFLEPPRVRVEGIIPIRENRLADMTFDVDGGALAYWKFNLSSLRGFVRWHDNQVTITNLDGGFYSGRLTGDFHLDSTDEPGDDVFRFNANFTDADLHGLMSDISTPTNRTYGAVSGKLIVTSAHTSDWKRWNGYGDIALERGFLWDTPLFGQFSRLLNVVSPGLGSSRGGSGKGTFTIINSVIHSDDLDIREPTARLKYNGTVDFDGNVESRVEAEILRDAPMFGRVFSFALWPVTKLFEYRVTGTLKTPKVEPLHLVPRFLLFPFHPLRTIEDIFSQPDKTPAPPENQPPAPNR